MKSSLWMNIVGGGAFLIVTTALYFGFVFAPTEATMGSIQRIFYFHIGADAVGLVAIVVAAVASIGYLRNGKQRWDHVAYGAMELGTLFGAIALATGMIWARPTWGTWWTWDPRLTTFLILWLIYVGYMMFRQSERNDPRIARMAAVIAIIGVVDVPFVWLAPRIWRSIHPALVFGGQSDSQFTFNMEPTMLPAVFLGIAGMLLIFTFFLMLRLRLEEMRDQIEVLRLAQD